MLTMPTFPTAASQLALVPDEAEAEAIMRRLLR